MECHVCFRDAALGDHVLQAAFGRLHQRAVPLQEQHRGSPRIADVAVYRRLGVQTPCSKHDVHIVNRFGQSPSQLSWRELPTDYREVFG